MSRNPFQRFFRKPRAPGPEERVGLFRVESWEEGGTLRCLVVANGDFATTAWLLSHDPRSGEMRYGRGLFPLELGDAPLRYARASVAAAIPQGPAKPLECGLFGVPHPFDVPLADYVTSQIVAGRVMADSTFVWGEGLGSGNTPYMDRVTASTHARVKARARRQSAHDDRGYNPDDGGDPDLLDDPVHLPALPLASSHEVPNIIRYADRMGRDGATVQHVVREAIRAGTVPIREALLPEAVAIPGPVHWSPKAQAFFGADGTAGERRRQAGRLYPAFAPAMAQDDEIGFLIDAGRPFEGRLRDLVSEWPGVWLTQGLPLATLRRLRSLDATSPFKDLCETVAAATRLPVDWLPRTGAEWAAFRVIVPQFAKTMETIGLSAEDLFRPVGGRWEEFLKRWMGEGHGLDGRTILPEYAFLAPDVSRHLEETLLRPLAACMAEEHDLTPQDLDMYSSLRRARVAGRLLFGGKSVFGLAKQTDRWHQGRAALEAALPRREARQSWPALIRPYRDPNGLEIVSLTDLQSLADEGRDGPDSRGVPGLDHCVGGYGRSCYAGVSHILSVRRPLPGGGFERVSTVEFRTDDSLTPYVPEGFQEGARDWDLYEAQHRGRGNSLPAREAMDAVGRLLDGIRARSIPVDPVALETRDARDFDTGYDWSRPGAMEGSFAAWSPYLGGDTVAAGFEGLRERVRQEIVLAAREMAAADPEGFYEAPPGP